MWIIILFLIFHEQCIQINSMELKGINSCQIPLVKNSNITTSSTSISVNTWCPSSFDNQPYLIISLSNLTYITRMNIKSYSSDIYYSIDYTRHDQYDESTIWRSYRLLNNKQENLEFNPPMIVKYIRINLKRIEMTDCIEFELFGCIFTDGVVSYSMLQGSYQLEDDTYDGYYNEKHRYLYDGLGQLSDGQMGPDNHQDSNGLQWIGWRRPRHTKSNYSIGILFTFDTVRNFSRLTIHSNNYYPNNIYVFRCVTIEFINSNVNSTLLTYEHQRDDQFEMARPIMIDLKNNIASKIKLRFFFDGSYILLSEITFDSFIIKSNSMPKINDFIQINNSYSLYIIVCLSIMIIILILTFIIILVRCLIRDRLKLNKSNFKQIHNHSDSSVSTTSSEIDIRFSQHRYATILPLQISMNNHDNPIDKNNMDSNSSPHYEKLMPTISLLRSPSIVQENHIESICGNCAFSTNRLFTFDFNQNQYISSENVCIKQRIENRYQIIGGGEIYQGELKINQTFLPITIRRIHPNTTGQLKLSFFNELTLLTSICHPNIIHAYGFSSEPTISLITESFDHTSMDLYQYLQRYKHEQPLDNAIYTLTLIFSIQISSALAYLESLHIYHRDIAARNCVILSDLNIKLHDLAMCNEIYADDYVLINNGNDVQTRRPIRWCSWETICLNQFSSKSDVFSFGVLLWEMLTMAERPHYLLNDDEVLENLRNFHHHLIIPSYASSLNDLINSCWNKNEHDRPSFLRINQILKEKHQLLVMSSNNYQQID